MLNCDWLCRVSWANLLLHRILYPNVITILENKSQVFNHTLLFSIIPLISHIIEINQRADSSCARCAGIFL